MSHPRPAQAVIAADDSSKPRPDTASTTVTLLDESGAHARQHANGHAKEDAAHLPRRPSQRASSSSDVFAFAPDSPSSLPSPSRAYTMNAAGRDAPVIDARSDAHRSRTGSMQSTAASTLADHSFDLPANGAANQRESTARRQPERSTSRLSLRNVFSLGAGRRRPSASALTPFNRKSNNGYGRENLSLGELEPSCTCSQRRDSEDTVASHRAPQCPTETHSGQEPRRSGFACVPRALDSSTDGKRMLSRDDSGDGAMTTAGTGPLEDIETSKRYIQSQLQNASQLYKSRSGRGKDPEKADAPIWVDWDGPTDPANPLNFSKARKWTISLIGILFCGVVSLSTSGYAIIQDSIQEKLGASREVVILGVTLFTFTFGSAPLLLAPLSEVYGRKPIYIASALIFTIFFVPQALAQNIGTILVSRFIAGIGGSTAVALVGGTLSDLWRAHERGLPMSLFALSAFAFTGLGPVALGYPAMILGFRWVNWIMFAASACFSVFVIFANQETRASVLLSRKAKRLRAETGDDRYQCLADADKESFRIMMSVSLTRPLRLLFTEPILAALALWISMAWGTLYLLLEGIPIVFGQVYGFNLGEQGLVFSTQIVGSLLGVGLDVWSNRKYLHNVARKGPEARLYIALVAAVCFPLGYWLYTWLSWSSVHWIAPSIGLTIAYIGLFGTYLAVFNYLSDAYTLYASSALAVMSFCRNVTGAVFPLFASQMYDALGIHGAGSLLAAVATLLGVIPFLIFKYGALLRSRSKVSVELVRLQAQEEARYAEAMSLASRSSPDA
ncbi:uncharacterized protein L969DRAFT_15311 [Mixia osmundae IAM 14324]|uniref:Major facilitator superfamily (MFS) profile domain-containing protein n=1 Tax=Mixia osmundae (strain CBS 9802 / IAM 14324 / JCM 22182 / KY 12970) TaxID=764103 RepID=G7DXA3_MIXOS|nr:uncharacterized protein L969DRAFT_15311 [Mixia osmundae IAM 14324]KEI41293.1 hypothetical protein L969DRAFT_15311 [Mixia osmundae IAM 14324]GAA95213.1 hypothetical protein E5Q_01869 [Mixia osmundae IAM 14324]